MNPWILLESTYDLRISPFLFFHEISMNIECSMVMGYLRIASYMSLYKPSVLCITLSCINILSMLLRLPVLLILALLAISVNVSNPSDSLIVSNTLSKLVIFGVLGAGTGVSNRRLFFLTTLDMSYHFPLICIY